MTEKQIAFNIKAERTRAGFTQEEVSKYLGMDRKNYAHYESGKGRIKATMLYQLAEMFGCTINSFYLQYNTTKRREQ